MSTHIVGTTIQCVRPDDGLTLGKRYYAIDEDYSCISVINDRGVDLYFPDECFRSALEIADERIVELEAEVRELRKCLPPMCSKCGRGMPLGYCGGCTYPD